MNDARLAVTIALTAAAHGAAVANHTEVLQLIKKPNPCKPASSSLPPPAHDSPKAKSEPHTVKAALEATAAAELKKSPETPTDTGITNSGDSSPTANLVQAFSNAVSHPSSAQRPSSPINPYALPFNPSPPPSLESPFKWLESLKTYIVGSSKNKETTTPPLQNLDDQIVAGAVVRDHIFVLATSCTALTRLFDYIQI